MQIKKKAFLSILSTTLILLCSAAMPIKRPSKKVVDKLYLFQNNKEIEIKGENAKIKIDKSKFSLRFYNKRYNPDAKELYAAQIAAFSDKSELDKCEIGMLEADIPYFSPGSGIAADRNNGYKELYLNNYGHHYLYYKDTAYKRLNLLGESGKILKLEFGIDKLQYNDREVKLSDTDLEEFYLAIFIDRNLNGIIDDGELHKLTIKLK